MGPEIKEYELCAELARGGMGSVYLARRRGERDGTCFAIKVMHAHLSHDPEAKLMMLDEAHTAARVRHTNVTSVVDIGSYDAGYYLVMEYVEGCSFQQLLNKNPTQRPVHLIVPIVLDMLRGLHAAHTLRDPNGEPYEIVHRDVSPHNVLVGLDGIARITDFGIAKARERYTATALGMKKGKPPFMAPELLRGENADPQVDVWAAGVTLYFALTGVFPFGEGVNPTTFANIVRGEVAAPSQVGLRPPACLDWVLMCALQKQRAARFPSAEAFADALQSVAQRHGLLGSPSDIGAWVKASWGHKLAELRREVARPSRPTAPIPPPPLPRVTKSIVAPKPKEEIETVNMRWDAALPFAETELAATPSRGIAQRPTPNPDAKTTVYRRSLPPELYRAKQRHTAPPAPPPPMPTDVAPHELPTAVLRHETELPTTLERPSTIPPPRRSPLPAPHGAPIATGVRASPSANAESAPPRRTPVEPNVPTMIQRPLRTRPEKATQ